MYARTIMNALPLCSTRCSRPATPVEGGAPLDAVRPRTRDRRRDDSSDEEEEDEEGCIFC